VERRRALRPGGPRDGPGPDARAGDHIDDVGQHLREDGDGAASASVKRVGGLGPAGRRHRARQRAKPLVIGGARDRQPACFEAPAVPRRDQPGEEAPPRGEFQSEQNGGGEVVERRIAQGLIGPTRPGEKKADCRARVERERRDGPGFDAGRHRATGRRRRGDVWRGPGVRRVTWEPEGQPARSSAADQVSVAGGRGLDGARHAIGRGSPRVGRDLGGSPCIPSSVRLEGRSILGPEVQAVVECPGCVKCKQWSGERVEVRTTR
jgi:hypothetical protein